MDNLELLLKLGLYQSVDRIVSLNPEPTLRCVLARIRALIAMKEFANALRLMDEIPTEWERTGDDVNELLEMRITCYQANPNLAGDKCFSLLSILEKRPNLSPKLRLMVADILIQRDSTPSPTHKAIPHLMKILELCPFAVEIIEKLIQIGAPVDPIIAKMPDGPLKTFVSALQLTYQSKYATAITCLRSMADKFDPPGLPDCAIRAVCFNAKLDDNMAMFDNVSKDILDDDLELVDLKAARYKELNQKHKLEELVQTAMNVTEDNPRVWLAFSHLLELTNDIPRALQATRKAVLLDRRLRKGFMRHGELRLLNGEYAKALTPFIKAHQILPGIDSYSSIIRCYMKTGNSKSAMEYAARCNIAYPRDSPMNWGALLCYAEASSETNPELAAQLAKKSLELKPRGNLRAVKIFIQVQNVLNQYDEAEAIVHKYAANTVSFCTFLADIYEMKGDLRKAHFYLLDAARRQPSSQDLRSRIAALERRMKSNSQSEDEYEDDEASY